ncbi:flagellin [Clostridium acetobutylicum]|nr:flagellin [Clostridium acetobutylicum]
MRITNRMLTDTFLTDMNTNLQNMRDIQSQLTSGKKIRKPSDNPYVATKSMQLNTDISINSQYNTNINNTIYWLNQTDTALNQAGNIVQRIKELLISAGNGGYTQDQRDSIKAELNQRISEFSNVINSSFSGQYLFGGTRGNEKPLDIISSASGNKYLMYSNQSIDLPVASGASNVASLASGCGDLDIRLGSGSTVQLQINSGDSIQNIVDGINSKIASSSSLKGKISAISYVKGNQTYIRVTALSDKDITITSGTNITALSSFKNQYIGVDKINQISKDLSVEISQGVLTQYSVNATEIMNYKGVSASGIEKSYDLRQVFSDIVTDLSSNSGVSNLNTKDAEAVDALLENILAIRSTVGASQNRMDSAQKNNQENNYNMTLILSNTEDTDITESTMNYAALQTVYLASLQTSAKIIQPTLMDYMS